MTITHLFVDQAVRDDPQVRAIQARLGLPLKVVDDAGSVYRTVRQTPDEIQKGKEVLFLTRNQGSFIKDCPGTRMYTCCGYKILHVGTYCTMDCAYCILQSYFHPPVLQLFLNHRAMFAELNERLAQPVVQRIGTGEFTDSLIWETWSQMTPELVTFFAQQSHGILELKTKTTAIQSLAGLEHNHKTIVAWSLNTEAVIGSEERRTATLTARLRAAAQCIAWGYPVAFHFDPMILYPGCEDAYHQVVERIFASIPASRIVWISLGTFRFMPDLKPVVASRFPDSKIIYGEFIQGLDGKMRYFKPLRIALYRQMAAWIRSHSEDVTVYLCMEDDEVWQKALGFIPASKGGLAHMLDKSAVSHCRLKIE